MKNHLQESKVHGQLQTNEIRAKLQQLAKVPALGKKTSRQRQTDRQTDRQRIERERETHTHTHIHTTHTHLVWEVSFEGF